MSEWPDIPIVWGTRRIDFFPVHPLRPTLHAPSVVSATVEVILDKEIESILFALKAQSVHDCLCIMASEALIEQYKDGVNKGEIRFIPHPARTRAERDAETAWWSDTWRPIVDKEEPYVIVQTYGHLDPNNYIKIKPPMSVLFTDQAEYYFVCGDCYFAFSHMQWSGSTRGGSHWRERAEGRRAFHERMKGWCEFCDPVFGSGGWRPDR